MYSALRPSIRSGDIILWSGKGLAARIVRWFTRSLWSHVAVAVWWGPRLMFVDSFPTRGTRVGFLSHSLKDAYWLPTRAKWNTEAHAFAIDELDRPYSFLNLWKTWLGLDLIGREYHCAQYAAAILGRAGVVDLSYPATPESVAQESKPAPEFEPRPLGLNPAVASRPRASRA